MDPQKQQQPISWKTSVGLNNVGSYQVSGAPFASGSLDCTSADVTITFPDVTRWVQVDNLGDAVLKVGFSEKGLAGTNHFQIPASGSSGRLELKISEIHLRGGDAGLVSVVAGLTNIDAKRTSTASGTSWSGSAGVG